MEFSALDAATATAWADEIAALLSQIPLCDFAAADVVATTKRDVPLLGRWDHSQVLMGDGRVVGVLLTYLRPSEPASPATAGCVVYPEPSWYLDGIAVAPELRRQGVASTLIERWLASTGDGAARATASWSLQTNGDDWNLPVRRLYERFGFAVVGTKRYDNRTDVVMRLDQAR